MKLGSIVTVLLLSVALAGCHSGPPDRKAVEEYEQAVEFFKAGNLTEARAAANRAVARDPQHIQARWLLATIWLKLDDPASAIYELQVIVRQAPDKAKAVLAGNRIGEILVRADDYEDARRWFEACLELLPDYEPSLINLGVMDLEEGWLERSEERLSRAVELTPRHANARVQYARVLGALGREDEAREQLRIALDCPDLEDAVRLKIRDYLATGG